jgi:diketogulonate reductase-like aldo/keto reductase
MITSINDYTVLNNGVIMPWLGFGVFLMEEGRETEGSVRKALEVGYRSIDTATIYENEAGVGKAIADSGIPREEIFVTTKVWNSDQGYERTLRVFDESLKKLNMDYVDLYLIHWPVKGRSLDTWKALEKLYEDGVVRAIGLSNYRIRHIKDILAVCNVKPTVNQVEFHPQLRQAELHHFCIENQIQLEAWAPLMQGRGLSLPEIIEISQKHDKTPAQVLIRWDLQHAVVTIPKSSTPERIAANADVFDFKLSEEDMARIDSLNLEQQAVEYPDDIDY